MKKILLVAWLAGCGGRTDAVHPDASHPDAMLLPDGAVDAGATTSPWLIYGHDPDRSGATAAVIGPNVSAVPRWQRTLPAGSATTGTVASEPVIAGGTVYFTSWNGLLYAVSLADGTDVWPPVDVGLYTVADTCMGWAGVEMGTTATPALDPTTSTIYVAGLHDGLAALYAIDAASGAVRWVVPISDDANEYPWSSPVVGAGSVFVGLASWGDCPLTQGKLVAVALADPHGVRRATTAPDGVAMFGPNGSMDLSTAGMAPDADGQLDWDYRVIATFDATSPTAIAVHLRLRHLVPGATYDVAVATDTANDCADPTSLGQITADAAGDATADRVLAMSVTDLFAPRRGLTVRSASDPTFVPCALIGRGKGGGIWSSPTYDAATGTVFVTTGTPVPPCPDGGCTSDRSTVGPRAPAIVAFDATTLAERGRYQIPLADQDWDPDFGASVTVCAQPSGGRRVGVGNKNGRFYVLDVNAAPGWQPIFDPRVAHGGPNPESGDGIISTAACANGVFYVGGGKTPNDTICTRGQIIAVDGATGLPPAGWTAPRCVGNVIGGIGTASGQLVFGLDDCGARPGPTCTGDAIEVCDVATGAVCTARTTFTDGSPTVSPVLSGAAISDGVFVIADGDHVRAFEATP